MNKFSIRCKYKNIQMKSILEARTALFFDLLNIKWIYEYNKYLLSDGSIVVPDFFLPELKTFFSCDDCIINFNNIKSIKNFLKNIGVKNDNL